MDSSMRRIDNCLAFCGFNDDLCGKVCADSLCGIENCLRHFR